MKRVSQFSKGGGVLVVLMAGFLLAGCHGKKPPPPKPKVSVLKVAESVVPVYREYISITQSVSSVDIRARVEGFLTKKNYTEGELVKKNQLIYVIDPRPYEAQLSLAQGQLSQAIAARDFQQVQYLRSKDLVAKGDVSKSSFDEVTASYAQTVAAVEVATAQVETAKINLGYCYMYSPLDGLISRKYVDVGNLVGGAENTLLVNIVKLDPMYVQFSPGVNDFALFSKFRDNMPFKVEVTLPFGNSKVFEGQVDLINNQAEVQTSTILMRAVIKNPDSLLRPNIYMNLKLHLSDTHKGILIPMTAVMESQGRRTVYVINKDNKIEVRLVTTSGQQGQQYVVESGLKDGELILLTGLQKVRPGEEVTPEISSN